ncbi:hypothetical protein ACA910_013225 [Epithemia clementina (nom. ined.)]
MNGAHSIEPSLMECTLPSLPLCMVTLDAHTLHPTAINDTFFNILGPLYKFRGTSFVHAASDDKDSNNAQERFQQAMEQALAETNNNQSIMGCVVGEEEEGDTNATTSSSGSSSNSSGGEPASSQPPRIRVRNIEMTTLAGESGFPVRRFFDWFISVSVEEEDTLILLGDPCTDHDVEQRERDSELIDFFQNAPIAMHWLSGEGKVLWANQTELNVLGYTAEEYIGQDIMKFCPDEQELVLEIFKQLGSGNTIKDVPVRFRTKDGKIVHLLIDSNVRYNKNGSFGHTRCFIRDDTGRKIREARSSLLLEETKRSLAMLDNFMTRSLHHLRTPLHVTQNMVDSIAQYFQQQSLANHKPPSPAAQEECKEMIEMASEQIALSVAFLEDVADLSKFDQGGVLHIHPELVPLESFGKKILNDMPPTRPGVSAVLELCLEETPGQGPALAMTDPKVLRRVLLHLLNNATQVTKVGTVTLGIGYRHGRLTFTVTDTGPGLEMPTDAADGDLPVIFQRYHKELLPEESLNLKVTTTLRDKIEEGINSHKKNGLGIGLSLSYHLVQSLGGELRCTSSHGKGAKFQFSLPRTATYNTSIPSFPTLVQTRITRSTVRTNNENSNNTNNNRDVAMLLGKVGNGAVGSQCEDSSSTGNMSCEISTLTPEMDMSRTRAAKRARSADIPSSFDMPREILPDVLASSLAAKGVQAQDPPSILVVDDTTTCAKMLCRILSQFRCAAKWAENGKVAVDILRQATPGTYDLILIDLRMPVMDGLEATRIIKHEMGIKIPVVALTGDDSEQTRHEAQGIGFDAFCGKPMKRNDLKAVVKQFTGYEVK